MKKKKNLYGGGKEIRNFRYLFILYLLGEKEEEEED